MPSIQTYNMHSNPGPNKAKGGRGGPFSNLVLDPCNADLTGLPDSYVGRTVPYRCKGIYTVTTDSSGNGAFFFTPRVTGGMYTSPTFTAGAVSAWGSATQVDKGTVIELELKTYRVIGGCVKVKYIGAEQTTAGRVVMLPTEALATADMQVAPSVWMADPDSRTYAADECDKEMRLWPFDAPVFQTASNSNQNYLYFPCAVVGITGAPPSTAALSIDVTLIIEYLPTATALSVNIAESYPSNPVDLAAATNAGAHVHDDPGAQKLRRDTVDHTFNTMGSLLSLGGMGAAGAAVAQAPAAFRNARRALKGVVQGTSGGKKPKNKKKLKK